MPKGTFYGVSLGPGDPGLITLRAWTLLESPADWAYAVERSDGESIALNTAMHAGVSTPAYTLALVIPDTQDAAILAKHYVLAARQIKRALDWGDDVVFLIEGDAATHTVFNQLVDSLKALDSECLFEQVPGVGEDRQSGADNCKKRSLSLRFTCAQREQSTICSLRSTCDALVVLNLKCAFSSIAEQLKNGNLLSNTKLIENLGSPEETVVSGLDFYGDKKPENLSLLCVAN